MVKFRILLSLFIIGISFYTGVVIYNYGLNLIPIFFGEMLAFTWQGQFNFDFMCFLIISGLWISWRHNFSAIGMVLGFMGFVLGIMFLAPYLLIVSYSVKGDIQELLIGKAKIGS